MAEERGWWDSIKDMSGKDWAGFGLESALYANPVTAGLSALFSPSEASAGEDESVAARNAAWAALSPEDKKRIIQERLSTTISEPVKRPVSTEKPFMSVSRTGEPPSKASAMPTKEDIISRLLASKSGPAITQGGGSPQTRPPSRISRTASPPSKATPPPTAEAIKSRLLAPKRGEYPPRTAAKASPSMGLEFGDVKGLSPSNVKTTAARREGATLKNKVIADAARKRRAAEARKVSTLLKERQAAPEGADIRSGKRAETKRKIAAAKKKRSQPSTVSEIAKTKETRKAVGTLLKDRQTAPDEVVIASGREAEAKRKAAKEKARLAKARKIPKQETKKVMKTEKKVAKKKFEGEPRNIKDAKKMGKKYYINKDGEKLAAVTKEDLAKFRKKTGNPKATLRQLLNSITGKTQKGMYRTAKKTGGGVGLHTAEMRSAGKDLHQPQSKIKKRIHEEITYAKKGGKVGKKKQGYKARKDESIAMRDKKKRTKKQLKASRNESYGKFGSGKGKGKINRFGSSLVASTYD